MVRNQLLRRANLLRARRVLEVGSGTGALTGELAGRTDGLVIGVDMDEAALTFAAGLGGTATYARGQAECLPFGDASFDVVYCHFLLLWVADAPLALREMRRVCRSGGFVLALAEPDY
ncbi:MAG: class I SAM-dependent methyltransferase, partial [Chloroflexota bacterium]